MSAKRQKTHVGAGAKGCEKEVKWYQHPWLQQVLDNDPSLTSLEVKHGDRVSDGAAKALMQALRANTSLKHLDITGDGITDETGVELAGAIRANGTIESLLFESDSITDVTGAAIAEALRDNVTLRSITIFSRHPVTYFFNSRSSGMIDDMHMTDSEDDDSCRTGKRSRQRRQWMTDRTARALLETIRVNKTLQRLELGVSSIRKDTITAVAQALAVNTTIQNCFVNGRAITGAGPGPTTAQLNAQARRKVAAMLKKAFPGHTM